MAPETIENKNGANFIHHKDFIQEGDTVIIYINTLSLLKIVVTRGKSLNMKYGTLRHEFLIGKRYGSQISATAGYVYALRPNPSLWTKSLDRTTQILYTPDIALVLLLLDARPGSVICETGTGSGSLSHAIATRIAPSGHLYTHDINEVRVRAVENDLKIHGFAGCTTSVLQDVCEDGFFVENACDGVFLDLPAPWDAIEHAKRAISRDRGGRLVGFSPCIEQVQKACIELDTQGFVQIRTMEIVPKKLKAVVVNTITLEDSLLKKSVKDANSKDKGKKRNVLNLMAQEPQNDHEHMEFLPSSAAQPTHTGYLFSGTLLPFGSD